MRVSAANSLEVRKVAQATAASETSVDDETTAAFEKKWCACWLIIGSIWTSQVNGASLSASNIQMPVTHIPILPSRNSSESEMPESWAWVGMMPSLIRLTMPSSVSTQAGELMSDSVRSSLKKKHSPF